MLYIYLRRIEMSRLYDIRKCKENVLLREFLEDSVIDIVKNLFLWVKKRVVVVESYYKKNLYCWGVSKKSLKIGGVYIDFLNYFYIVVVIVFMEYCIKYCFVFFIVFIRLIIIWVFENGLRKIFLRTFCVNWVFLLFIK